MTYELLFRHDKTGEQKAFHDAQAENVDAALLWAYGEFERVLPDQNLTDWTCFATEFPGDCEASRA